jgi:uncharacterized protein YutE (UPF0331/DUF86 family)
MTNASLVERKLGVITDHVARMKTRRPPNVESFRTDLLVQDAISMSLLVAVQEALDVSLHIASDEGWELAPTSRDAFLVLAKNGVLEVQLAGDLGQIAQLRNRIAHGYATLDADRLWGELPSGIVAFEAFIKAVARFLIATGG